MKKRLVVAGGGHAHMTVLARLGEFIAKGCEVTVIGPSDHHYYSGMGPGMLGGFYRPEEIRFATRQLVEKSGGIFIRDTVTDIDAEQRLVRLAAHEPVGYDVLSCNLGSQVPDQLVTGPPDDVFFVKPIERLQEARRRIIDLGSAQPLRIGLVGGGPSAAEIAGNVWRIGRQPGMQPLSITMFAGSRLLPSHPEGVRRLVRRSLLKRGIEIREGRRVNTIERGRIGEVNGTEHFFDIIFVAVGVRPSSVFQKSGLPTGPDGGLLVNRFLQSTAYNTIFGGGDCISYQEQPLDKVGVYAVRQNEVLYHNLQAALSGGELRAFEPGGSYLLIFNLGDDTGVLHKWSILFGGRPAFWLKDWIDRRFMRAFQRFEHETGTGDR